MNHPKAVASLLRKQATEEQLDLLDATITEAEKNDTPLYLVGGAVRDLLLGRFAGDLDLVVEGSALKLAEVIASSLGGGVETHQRFATAKVSLGSAHIDLASTRKEHYPSPAALPVIEPGTLEEDLARRDFTVNAMAVSLWPSKEVDLIDPYDGFSDLQRGVLEVFHPKSFEDDPTRILRAVRIEAQSPLRLSDRSVDLARSASQSGVFDQLSGARLRNEIELLFNASPDLESVAGRLADLGMLEALSPALALDAATQSWLQRLSLELSDPTSPISAADPPQKWVASLLILADSLGPTARADLVRRLDLSGEHAARIEAGLSRVVQTETELDKVDLEPSRVDELLRSLSPEERILLAASVEPVVRDWVVRWNREMRELRLSITGADLLGLGFEPGPQVGQALTETRRARLDGRIKAEDERQFALALLASASGTT